MGRTFTRYISLFCAVVVFMFTGGVLATWRYFDPLDDQNANLNVDVNEFIFTPDMPEGEVSLLDRLYEILNNLYEVENDENLTSCEYLLERTILQEWEPGAPPYVGSMEVVGKDENSKGKYADQVNALFGDILDNEDYHVSFILKNENLIGPYDGLNEIAMYSTSDPLDYCLYDHTNIGIVGVYVSVYTPVVDDQNNVIGYELVCDSMYGFCNEIHYNDDRPDISSFSTTDWRDNLVFWHHLFDTQLLPDNAIALDGVSLYKYHYESYHSRKYTYEGYPWGYTNTWIDAWAAKTMSQKLYELLAEKEQKELQAQTAAIEVQAAILPSDLLQPYSKKKLMA